MMKKVFLVLAMGLGLIAVVGGTSIRAQQAAASPSLADTMAWIQQHSSYWGSAYTWTQVTAVTTAIIPETSSESVSVYESFTLGPAAPCHLTVTANSSSSKPNMISSHSTTYDINLSGSTVDGITAVPFDLLGYISPMLPFQPENGDTLTSPAPNEWEIKGLVYQNGGALSPFDEGTTDTILLVVQSDAQSLANALNHAVDLCGGQPAPKSLF
jgi:hypothetical protein